MRHGLVGTDRLLELDPFAGVCEREIQRGLRDPHRLE
jgi:hypothetical protein